MFDVQNGYTKRTWDDLLQVITDAINGQFNTDYTVDTITGSNQFKFFYGGLQLVMESENKINELGVKMADYIRSVNESISEPISSVDGTITYFKNNLGLDVSLKPIIDSADAGKPVLCVDVNTSAVDFNSIKQNIFDAMHHSQTEGLYWFNPSTEPAAREYRGEASASNGQAFPYCFFAPEQVELKVKITITRSNAALAYQINASEIAELFRTNFASIYKLGNDFEAERYLNTGNISSAANIKIESSLDDGATWAEGVREMNFDTKITIDTIEVIEG